MTELKKEFKIVKNTNLSDALALIASKDVKDHAKGYAFFAKKVVEEINETTFWCKVDEDDDDEFIKSFRKYVHEISEKYLNELDFFDFECFCEYNIQKTMSSYIDYQCNEHYECDDPECDSGDFFMQLQCELIGGYNG